MRNYLISMFKRGTSTRCTKKTADAPFMHGRAYQPTAQGQGAPTPPKGGSNVTLPSLGILDSLSDAAMKDAPAATGFIPGFRDAVPPRSFKDMVNATFPRPEIAPRYNWNDDLVRRLCFVMSLSTGRTDQVRRILDELHAAGRIVVYAGPEASSPTEQVARTLAALWWCRAQGVDLVEHPEWAGDCQRAVELSWRDFRADAVQVSEAIGRA